LKDLKIRNSQDFSLSIEKLVMKTRMKYIDAILYYCDETNIEPETAASLLTSSMKYKISLEAEDLNLLPKVTRLPGL
jgi:hypothetical protein|tara:strand:- start:1791 stop:2021 length:231 start_codon:yes stop_codon:yes gene_type:complete